MDIRQCTMFPQGGTPCHLFQVATDPSRKTESLCRNGPYLNPIEHLWTILRDNMAERQPSTAQNLKQVIKDVWVTEITQGYCVSLVPSRPRHIQVVIDSKEGHTAN